MSKTQLLSGMKHGAFQCQGRSFGRQAFHHSVVAFKCLSIISQIASVASVLFLLCGIACTTVAAAAAADVQEMELAIALQNENVMGNRSNYSEYIRHIHLPLFEPLPSLEQVLGPSVFPKPNSIAHKLYPNDDIVPNLKPVHGIHRPKEDAVFLFAGEYMLDTYLLFLSSLRETGYMGDVVIACTKMDWEDLEVQTYLKADPHVIVYALTFHCLNAEGQLVESMKSGIRVCQCHNLYGRQIRTSAGSTMTGNSTSLTGAGTGAGGGTGTTVIRPLPDLREARTVPTTRYELYWIWSLWYSKYSWILLIDARDAVFQLNPFDFVERRKNENDIDGGSGNGGLLYLFGENMEATRIGQSKKNHKWLRFAYGSNVAELMTDKPTICSGSTMGEQMAIETYLRAMVAESDETGVKLMGADQGFHNYLYYSNKLSNAQGIWKIRVFDQGSGIINNLGAMRTKELSEWGNGKLVESNGDGDTVEDLQVLNWDSSTSPVVHQFDRHKLLSAYWYKQKTAEYRTKWEQMLAKAKTNTS